MNDTHAAQNLLRPNFSNPPFWSPTHIGRSRGPWRTRTQCAPSPGNRAPETSASAVGRGLAVLYDVETRVLLQAVKRNNERFPKDFMSQLTKTELSDLRSQSVTSSDWGGRRYPPYAFTEQGVAMLSSVLRSERAVQVNDAIRELMKPSEPSRERPIGFASWDEK